MGCLFLLPLTAIDPLRHDHATALAGGKTEEILPAKMLLGAKTTKTSTKA